MSEFGHVLQPSEVILRLTEGAAREFKGDAAEGVRADELNKATGYAFSAAPEDLDEVPAEQRHQMAHQEVVAWLSANDPKSRMTRVIYEANDPEQKMQGYVYVNRTDADIQVRAKRAKELAAARGYAVDENTSVFEMNFDAPWHEGDEYVNVVAGGARQTLQELFIENPDACVMMYVEKEDYFPDGKVLKDLGATRIGKDTYLNAPETRLEKWKDNVFFMDKPSFDAASTAALKVAQPTA